MKYRILIIAAVVLMLASSLTLAMPSSLTSGGAFLFQGATATPIDEPPPPPPTPMVPPTEVPVVPTTGSGGGGETQNTQVPSQQPTLTPAFTATRRAPDLPNDACWIEPAGDNTINVRGDPSTKNTPVGAISFADKQKVVGYYEGNSGWYRTDIGWVASWVVKTSDPCQNLPHITDLDTVAKMDAVIKSCPSYAAMSKMPLLVLYSYPIDEVCSQLDMLSEKSSFPNFTELTTNIIPEKFADCTWAMPGFTNFLGRLYSEVGRGSLDSINESFASLNRDNTCSFVETINQGTGLPVGFPPDAALDAAPLACIPDMSVSRLQDVRQRLQDYAVTSNEVIGASGCALINNLNVIGTMSDNQTRLFTYLQNTCGQSSTDALNNVTAAITVGSDIPSLLGQSDGAHSPLCTQSLQYISEHPGQEPSVPPDESALLKCDWNDVRLMQQLKPDQNQLKQIVQNPDMDVCAALADYVKTGRFANHPLPPTLTPTLTPSFTLTLSPTITPSLTITSSPTVTPSYTLTPSQTLTLPPDVTPSATRTPSITPTASYTPSPTHTLIPTLTNTLKPPPTSTPVPTATLVASPTRAIYPPSTPLPPLPDAQGVFLGNKSDADTSQMQLFVYQNGQASPMTSVTEGDILYPALDSSGKQIAYLQRDQNNKIALLIKNVDKGGSRKVALYNPNGLLIDASPIAWYAKGTGVPDSDIFLTMVDSNNKKSIYQVKTGERNPTTPTMLFENASWPTFLHESTTSVDWIAFVQPSSTNKGTIYYANYGTQQAFPISGNMGDCSSPTFGTNFFALFFRCVNGDQVKIYRNDGTSTMIEILLSTNSNIAIETIKHFAPGPVDGEIAFDDGKVIYFSNEDGTKLIKLPYPNYNIGMLAWAAKIHNQ